VADKIWMRPWVDIFKTEEQNGQKQHKDDRQGSHRGNQKAANRNTPFAAHYVVQQQNTQTAKAKTGPVDEGKQVGLKELLVIGKVAGTAE
jgi:hypothetical protein